MIIVVEGISAAGKTTYSCQFGDHIVVPEIPAKDTRPDADASFDDHARFWAEHNVRRFQMALEVEREHGFAVCDTDPMKIHYSWCMERAGHPWPDKFANARRAVRATIEDGRLGFADLYLVKPIAPDVARAQKQADTGRRRGNFERHLSLQPHLMHWFEAISQVFPGRVHWEYPDRQIVLDSIQKETPETNPRRYDVAAFDALIEGLPT